MNRALTLLQKAVDVRPNEVRALLLACFFNFVILGSYYVIRPIRDEIGAAGKIETLPWLYTGTMIVTLVANALFSATVAQLPRRKFLPLGYQFLIANLLVFYFLMRTVSPAQNVWVGRAFFIWVSVFNLFVVTLFWAFMTDLFNSEQAKRLFAFIAVGGQLGAIAGPLFTVSLVQRIGSPNLLLVAAVILEFAPWCVKFFPVPDPDRNEQPNEHHEKGAEQPIGGGIVAAFTHVVRSPYLLGICAFMLLYAVTSTFVYFQQADLAGRHFHDRATRTAFFAQLDLAVNTLTIFGQLLITGRLLKWFGVGVTLAFLPALSLFGFIGMGLVPAISLLAVLQVMRRAGNFAITRPAREVLFTVLRREDKYKAKSFIDTFVYRTGDQVGAWSYAALTWLGLGLTGVSFVAAPLAAIWCGLSIWLGKKQAIMAEAKAN